MRRGGEGGQVGQGTMRWVWHLDLQLLRHLVFLPFGVFQCCMRFGCRQVGGVAHVHDAHLAFSDPFSLYAAVGGPVRRLYVMAD